MSLLGSPTPPGPGAKDSATCGGIQPADVNPLFLGFPARTGGDLPPRTAYASFCRCGDPTLMIRKSAMRLAVVLIACLVGCGERTTPRQPDASPVVLEVTRPSILGSPKGSLDDKLIADVAARPEVQSVVGRLELQVCAKG